MRSINLIVIHCSASANGKPLSIEEVDRWHRERGFRRNPRLIGYNSPGLKHIAYHFFIHTNGVVLIGRGLREVGAHAKGHNLRSIGVCMVGTDKFTVAQWDSLRGNISGLLKQFPHSRVCGHRDLSPDLDGDGTVEPHEWLKTCPGFNVAGWMVRGMVPHERNVLEHAQ